MRNLMILSRFGMQRRIKDFFIIFYNIVFPIVLILLLGYLASKSYGSEFTAYHYYSLMLLPFCLLLGITNVAYATQEEHEKKTSYRYLVAPISKTQLILSKLISTFVVLMLCNICLLGLTKILFQIDFQGSFVLVLLSLMGLTLAICGIGIYLGLACKNFLFIKNFLNLPIMVFGMLGGAFFPMASSQPFLACLINLSPLTWINRGILECIYEGNVTLLWATTLGGVMVGIVMTLFAIVHFKKEAYL